MRIYITFGDEKYKKTRDFSIEMAKRIGGFDRAIAYSMDDVDEGFKKMHADIFRIKRGAGLWLWKPYVIYKTLCEVAKDGDMVFYADGGSFLIRNILHIEKSMKGSDLWVSHVPLQEWQFTKADAFQILGCDNDKMRTTAQIQGGFLYIRKTCETVKFIKEWLDCCCDLNLLHPENLFYGLQNPKGFVAHREDQSILSLLCKKKGIEPHHDPSQFGKYPEKYIRKGFVPAAVHEAEYPVCIILHRTPDVNWLICLKQILLVIMPSCWASFLIRPFSQK